MAEIAPGKLTRQQIYDRIRESSKDEYILEEMIRLGFWPRESQQPSLPAKLIQRQGELERELRQLMAKEYLLTNPEAALKAMRKERMAQSRQRREENKAKRIEAAESKAAAWQHRRRKEILYLGGNVSQGLNHTASQTDRLAAKGLPYLTDAQTLAKAFGITLSELRFLTYCRPAATVTHYRRFEIGKKSGGTRIISAPMPRLKSVQYWILNNLLNQIQLPETVHGFVALRSIVSNAAPHIGAKVVINLDLKNFFPTITYPRVKGLFHAWGYSEQISTLLAMLCTEPDTQTVALDGRVYYVGLGPRYLPQGAPTSPALSNAVCCRMDRRLSGMARRLGFRYTRYADDMTFSTIKNYRENILKLMWRTRQIIAGEGFKINEDKTRIMHAGRRQEVTGLVVNRKLSVNRKELRRFRALLHQIEKDGPTGKSWGRGKDLFAAIKGYAQFVRMVNPQKGSKLLEQVHRIIKTNRPPSFPLCQPYLKGLLSHRIRRRKKRNA